MVGNPLRENELAQAVAAIRQPDARRPTPKVPDAFLETIRKLEGATPFYGSFWQDGRFEPIAGRIERVEYRGNGTIASATLHVELRELGEQDTRVFDIPLTALVEMRFYRHAK